MLNIILGLFLGLFSLYNIAVLIKNYRSNKIKTKIFYFELVLYIAFVIFAIFAIIRGNRCATECKIMSLIKLPF